ncbi:hypothetical protein [Cellulomonas pakistanensis]|uniref:Uncharacterized protein n=1 Tax=Cellulomonas pakistanensis TaxID=992287 RepID=A0A919PDE3_9CELL|nr:hypothetical protein [Cellulomonas pakistanensis]GIG36859.1 hypothetical protein Cpa01nite_22400 [Cellulomonas pakistanensis]
MPTRPTTHDPAAAGAAAVPASSVAPAPTSRRALRGAAALGAVALLAACASADPGTSGDPTTEPATPTPAPTGTLELVAGSSVVGLPDGLDAPPVDAAAGAARTSDDTLLYVVTWGSSTCPQVADPEASADGDGVVRVTFAEPGDGPCTMDYVPATSVVALPDATAPDADLTVAVGEWGEVALPAGSVEPGWVLAEG